MSEENKALYKKFIDEVINKKNLDVVNDLIGPGFVDHNPMPGTPPGSEGMKQAMEMFISAFPDMTSDLTFLVAEGDLVVGHQTTKGTHKGDLMGIPATGKKVEFAEIHIVRIKDGKAVEHWGLADGEAMMQQLGVMPG